MFAALVALAVLAALVVLAALLAPMAPAPFKHSTLDKGVVGAAWWAHEYNPVSAGWRAHGERGVVAKWCSGHRMRNLDKCHRDLPA